MKKIQMRLVKRAIRHFWQRLYRGWDDSDTWSLDYSLAKLILPRLKRFKEITNVAYDQERLDDIDKMIKAFEFLGSEERWDCTDKNKWNEVQEGLDLFAKHYVGLWW